MQATSVLSALQACTTAENVVHKATIVIKKKRRGFA